MVFPINCPYCGETAKRNDAGTSHYCPACGAKERLAQYVTTTNSTAAPPLVMRVPRPKKDQPVWGYLVEKREKGGA